MAKSSSDDAQAVEVVSLDDAGALADMAASRAVDGAMDAMSGEFDRLEQGQGALADSAADKAAARSVDAAASAAADSVAGRVQAIVDDALEESATDIDYERLRQAISDAVYPDSVDADSETYRPAGVQLVDYVTPSVDGVIAYDTMPAALRSTSTLLFLVLLMQCVLVGVQLYGVLTRGWRS